MSTQNERIFRPGITPDMAAYVLLGEYRAMTDLLVFRLVAMDRHLPLAAGLVTGVLAWIPSLPATTQCIALWCIPAAATWLVANTVTHARSKSDHLQRIADLELELNELAGRRLMTFQSEHPSRGRIPGGRSGRSTIYGVLVLAISLTVGAVSLASGSGLLESTTKHAFAGYAVLAAFFQAGTIVNWRHYRSHRSPFVARRNIP